MTEKFKTQKTPLDFGTTLNLLTQYYKRGMDPETPVGIILADGSTIPVVDMQLVEAKEGGYVLAVQGAL